jgi:hypothetical protein
MVTVVTKHRLRALAAQVEKIVANTPVYDIHTHLYDPAFGPLLLWGIDDLLVYHYLVAEAFRYDTLPYDKFFALPKTEQANRIWNALFIQHSPLSESCRGVLTTLNLLGLQPKKRDLPALRQWFAKWKVNDYVTRCLQLARVKTICMTNSPFDDQERHVWERGFARDERFTAALRIDTLLVNWTEAVGRLAQWGYAVGLDLSAVTMSEVRRFLADWTRRIQPQYLMVSLGPQFQFPDQGPCGQLIAQAVLPHCREHGLPLALMLGVKRAVNPPLGLAGDGVGLGNLDALENLCAQYPNNKFMATVLARENQHALAVITRKFRNLHPFGCWWFTNVPYCIEEITRLRLELLGLSFTAQHSDARVLDQIIYKWNHSRRLLAKVLTDKYTDLVKTGWEPTAAEIERDVKDLLGGAFARFCQP